MCFVVSQVTVVGILYPVYCRSWFYPHHYAPYISDIAKYAHMYVDDFDMSAPFHPFEQLLAVLPADSRNCLPEAFHDLMTEVTSPLIDFYPTDFGVFCVVCERGLQILQERT